MLFLMAPVLTFSQTEVNSAEEERKNEIVVNVAYTFVPEGSSIDNIDDRGHFIPSVGIDYFRELDKDWRLGLMLDLELGEYLIPRRKELKREYAFLILPAISYAVHDQWNLVAAVGVELEKNENMMVARFGVEYVYELNKEWAICAGGILDLKNGYQSTSITVGIAKAF